MRENWLRPSALWFPFQGSFFEPSLHMTSRIIFLAYLYGQLIGFTLTTHSNYMKCREEALLKKSESDSSDLVC